MSHPEDFKKNNIKFGEGLSRAASVVHDTIIYSFDRHQSDANNLNDCHLTFKRILSTDSPDDFIIRQSRGFSMIQEICQEGQSNLSIYNLEKGHSS